MISTSLRQRTADLHVRVERAVDLERRCSTLAGYRGLLARLWGLYAPLERELARVDWGFVGLEFGSRRKTSLLCADLVALGMDPGGLAELPKCASVRQPATSAAAVGTLYVVEGATLGATVIARQLRQRLGVEPGRGGSFHAGYGSQTAAMWRQFLSAADHYCGEDPDKADAVVAAARATFVLFIEWIEEAP